MKHIKFIFWAFVIGLLALLIFQNQEFFFQKTTLNMDFYFNANKNPVPPLPNVLLFLTFFFVGLFIAYLISLFGQFKSKKTIKNLNATIQSQMEVLSSLKSEIAAKDAQIEKLKNKKTKSKSEEITEPAPKEADPSTESVSNEDDPINKEENKIS